MLCLYLQAPFATFRTFTAGSFRPTAAFITPSAAYGLLLNLAGIEIRKDDGKSYMTLIRDQLPKFKLAIGALEFPLQHSVYQQLHNYPVGADAGKKYKPLAYGNKYNITPVRRSFLSDIYAYLCLNGNAELENQIQEGLKGNRPREYGLPFLGDNNFLIDKIECVSEIQPAYWFERLQSENDEGMRERVTRLTISIDRADLSNTNSDLFTPTSEKTKTIPEGAWITVGY